MSLWTSIRNGIVQPQPPELDDPNDPADMAGRCYPALSLPLWLIVIITLGLLLLS